MNFFDINENTENESECSEIYPLCKYYNSEIQNSDFYENYDLENLKSESDDNFDNDNEDDPFIIINTKREKQIHICSADPEKRNHTFNSKDNMSKTIKIKFFRFLYNLCNDYIKFITKDPKKKLVNILHAVKTNVTIKVNLIIKDFTLKEIYSLPIGKKFQNYEKNHNEKLIKELSDDKVEFKNFFNTKLSDMFPYFVDIRKRNELYKKFKIKKAVPLYELAKTCKQFSKRKIDYINKLFNLGNNFFCYFLERNQRTSQSQKKLLVYLNRIIKER